MFSIDIHLPEGTFGSAADWAMVLVTFATGIFLVLTFISQQKLKKIELLRYVDSIKPSYNGEVFNPVYKESLGEFEAHLGFLFSNTNSLAFDIEIKLVPHDAHWAFMENDNYIHFPYTARYLTHRLFIAKYQGPKYACTCSFAIEFSDKIGNRYFQSFMYSYDSNASEFKITIPVPIGIPILKV